METPKFHLTEEMVKNAKLYTCDCGGEIFESALIFKKLSPIISPTGKEEMYPLEVIVCKKCGKVPSWFNEPNILPESVLAKNNNSNLKI
jgi:hypothetical protein